MMLKHANLPADPLCPIARNHYNIYGVIHTAVLQLAEIRVREAKLIHFGKSRGFDQKWKSRKKVQKISKISTHTL